MNTIRYSLITLLYSALTSFSANPPQLDAHTIAANAQHTEPSKKYTAHEKDVAWVLQRKLLLDHASTANMDDFRQYCADNNIDETLLFNALILASQSGNCHAIDRLLAAGADINGIEDENARTLGSTSMTPLTWAMICSEAEAVQLLIARGAWINVCDTDGTSACLHAIWERGKSGAIIPILTLLKTYGADFFKNNRDGESVLVRSMERLTDPSLTVPWWLINNGLADVEAEDAWRYCKQGKGLLDTIKATPAKITLLAHNGVPLNTMNGSCQQLNCAALCYQRAINRLAVSFWTDSDHYRNTKAASENKPKIHTLARLGARLAPEVAQELNMKTVCQRRAIVDTSYGNVISYPDALYLIPKAHEQRCKAIVEALIGQQSLPYNAAILISQFSDDALLQESLMMRHNLIHAVCEQYGAYDVLEDLIRQFSGDTLKRWEKMLLNPVHQ